jgi:DNA integrity scanning protein DisA with diadenylate cyclase activity
MNDITKFIIYVVAWLAVVLSFKLLNKFYGNIKSKRYLDNLQRILISILMIIFGIWVNIPIIGILFLFLLYFIVSFVFNRKGNSTV